MVAGDGGCQARSRLVLPRLDDADDAAAADDLPRESRHGKDEGHLDPGVDFHGVIGEEEDPERLMFSVRPSCQAVAPIGR